MPTIKNAYAVQNEDFLDHIDVVCPKCAKHAVVTGEKANQYSVPDDNEIRCVCSHCGFISRFNEISKSTVFTNSQGIDVKSNVLYFNSPCDPYFQFEVWYHIPTTYGSLWAYNLEHFQVIENFIADKLRSRNGLDPKNKSIASRLPTWASNAKNREYLLKTIKKFIKQ